MTYKTAMMILPLLLAFVTFGQNMISAEEPPRCPATASQRSIYGMMLKGHVYKTEMAGIGLDCVLMCRTDDRCQSFNFVISRHLCEFNDRTKEARPKDFVADPDRYYYSKDINRVPLGSINDLAVESCKEIKASEPQATSGNFWLSTIKRGMVLQAYCDMKTFDVDECSASSPVCDKNGICNNTVGSYNCTCKQGYSSVEGKRCKENVTLSSAILNKVQGKYLEKLKTFLYPVLQNAPPVKFVRCWRALTDGWGASTFHNNCDGKGPTVTIIQVGAYIFGGYTDKSWSSSCAYVSSSKSFIYSLYSVNGYYPMQLEIKSGQEGYAIYTCNTHSYGPTFGYNHDIYISNNAASNQGSFFSCGYSYHPPPGYSSVNSSCNAFFAGSHHFTPTDIEVFYETKA